MKVLKQLPENVRRWFLQEFCKDGIPTHVSSLSGGCFPNVYKINLLDIRIIGSDICFRQHDNIGGWVHVYNFKKGKLKHHPITYQDPTPEQVKAIYEGVENMDSLITPGQCFEYRENSIQIESFGATLIWARNDKTSLRFKLFQKGKGFALPISWKEEEEKLNKQEVIRESLNINISAKKALEAAVSAIHFNDNSDYLRALYTVVSNLSGIREVSEEDIKMLFDDFTKEDANDTDVPTIPSEIQKKPWSFCETPKEKCTMNYCDENGCQNRKRVLVEESLEINKYEEINFLQQKVSFLTAENEALKKLVENKIDDLTGRVNKLKEDKKLKEQPVKEFEVGDKVIVNESVGIKVFKPNHKGVITSIERMGMVNNEFILFYEIDDMSCVREFEIQHAPKEVESGDLITKLVDFYMWMQRNGYDHNVRSRVEKKASIFLETTPSPTKER